MAAHRYWKTIALEAAAAGVIEATEFWLLAGATRVDASAVLSGSTPVSGALASLQDDAVGTVVVLPVRAYLQWDFGAGGGADVTDIRIGAADDPKKFPIVCGLAYSDDGSTWTQTDMFAGILWPGARTKTSSEQLGNLRGAVAFSISPSGAPKFTATTVEVFDNNGAYLQGKAPGSGVRQFEVVRSAVGGSGIQIYVGVAVRSVVDTARGFSQSPASGAPVIWYSMGGTKIVNGTGTSYGATWVTGDAIQCVVDLSTGQVTFYKNGVSQGVAGTMPLSAGDLIPIVVAAGSSGSTNTSINTFRTRGFTNAIAGAVPWEDRSAIATNAFQGRTAMEAQRGAANNGHMPVGAAKPTPSVDRLRSEFYIGAGANGLGRMVGRVRGFTLDYVNPQNKPYRCRVRLFRETDGLLIRELWSGSDGAYDFQWVDETQSYTVLAYYLDHGKRAVISDGLTLANGKVELMA